VSAQKAVAHTGIVGPCILNNDQLGRVRLVPNTAIQIADFHAFQAKFREYEVRDRILPMIRHHLLGLCSLHPLLSATLCFVKTSPVREPRPFVLRGYGCAAFVCRTKPSGAHPSRLLAPCLTPLFAVLPAL
jgi:hypothetical protein